MSTSVSLEDFFSSEQKPKEDVSSVKKDVKICLHCCTPCKVNKYEFCPICGTKLSEIHQIICNGCGKAFDSSFQSCPYCGKFVEDADVLLISQIDSLLDNLIKVADTFEQNEQYDKAFSIYVRLANINNIRGLSRIASFYKYGHFVEQDSDKACEWFIKCNYVVLYGSIFRFKSFNHYDYNFLPFPVLKSRLDTVLETLPNREKEALTLFFGLVDGHLQSAEEVADKLGVTVQRVHNLIAKALRRLRSKRTFGLRTFDLPKPELDLNEKLVIVDMPDTEKFVNTQSHGIDE